MSGLHSVLQSFVPPAVPALLRRIWPTMRHPIWKGIYRHCRDVPAFGGTYDDQRRVIEMSEEAERLFSDIQKGKKLTLWHQMLASVAALVAADRGSIRVIDFGGGMGTGFLQLLTTLPPGTAIRYDVIEMEKMCSAGRELYKNEPRICFHASLDDCAPAPDIVYVNSALQYVDDYAGQLRGLAALNAPWLLLARLAAGNIPTFATQQMNLPGQLLPYWFLNLDEVVTILSNTGYRLAFDGVTEREYEQSNFPETHRIGQMRDLMFAGFRAISASHL